MVLFQRIGMFFEPFVIIVLVKRYAYLKNVDKGKPLVSDGLLDDLFGVLAVGRIGAADERGVLGDSDSDRVERLQGHAVHLYGRNHVLF